MAQSRRRKKLDPPGREARRSRPVKQQLVQFRRSTLHHVLMERESIGQPASAIARRDLTRYYGLLAHSLKSAQLTPDDLRRLAKMARGVDFQTIDGVQRLPALVEGVVGKHDGLAMKLRGFSVVELYAVVDAVERWQNKPRP